MERFVFQGFKSYPPGPARILHVVRQLEQTEVGRLFLINSPQQITFRFSEGDAASRASANSTLDIIKIPRNTFTSPFKTQQTVIHELAHLLQRVQQLDPDLKGLLNGLYPVLSRHRADRRFAWVTEPLDRVRTEETMAQDVVGLIFRLGWGRDYRNSYYVPGDEGSPPPGALRPTLSASDRGLFLAAIRRLQAARLSPEQLRANWEGFEECYSRALKIGWVGEDARFRALLKNGRLQRGGASPGR